MRRKLIKGFISECGDYADVSESVLLGLNLDSLYELFERVKIEKKMHVAAVKI
jgi:hypothetical protein